MESQIVVFELNSEYFGVEIAKVESIIKMQPITQIPHVPDFVEGVTNLRGRVLPVIDLRKRLGLVQGETTKNTRIMVVEITGTTVGLVVDGVSEVLQISAGSVESLPPIVNTLNSACLKGIVRLENRLIVLLELGRVLDLEEGRSLETLAT
jgi:purine-binding chemotaxis protein CheW